MSGKVCVSGRKCEVCLCKYCKNAKCFGRLSCLAETCNGATVGCRDAK